MRERPPLTFRRYEVSYLSNVASCMQPMTTELAEIIRCLRQEHRIAYADLGHFLSQSDPDAGASFGLGKALTELAALHLHEDYRTWL